MKDKLKEQIIKEYSTNIDLIFKNNDSIDLIKKMNHKKTFLFLSFSAILSLIIHCSLVAIHIFEHGIGTSLISYFIYVFLILLVSLISFTSIFYSYELEDLYLFKNKIIKIMLISFFSFFSFFSFISSPAISLLFLIHIFKNKRKLKNKSNESLILSNYNLKNKNKEILETIKKDNLFCSYILDIKNCELKEQTVKYIKEKEKERMKFLLNNSEIHND